MKTQYFISRRLSVIIFSFILLTAMSCKKILEQEPRNSTYDGAYWQNARDCRSALAGNYALLRAAVTSGTFNPSPRYYMYGDALTNTYISLQYWGDGLEAIQNGDFSGQYNLNSLADWTLFYKAIAMSNLILKKIPAVPDENLSDVSNPARFKNGVMGQALFIRALSYFMMTRVWGDVPVVLESYDDPLSAPKLPRSSKAEVMAQIEKDCHQAAELLQWGYQDQGEAHVTANRGSVYALLAHLYLWKATMKNVKDPAPDMTDVNSADTTISTLIAKGGYTLTDTTKYYNTFIGKSTEGIFELSMSEDSREGSNWHVANMFLRSGYIAYNSDNSRAYVNKSYLTSHFYKLTPNSQVRLIDSLDIRYRKNFDDRGSDRPTAIKYSNVIYRNPGQQRDAYVSNNMIIFRLSDMKLLQAEIALYKNLPAEATRIINSFRQRYGASEGALLKDGLSKDELMNEYILERGKELFLEGHIFYDLLRTRKYEEYVPWLTATRFAQEGFYWPVYPKLFSDNNLLKQTTYWLGKI